MTCVWDSLNSKLHLKTTPTELLAYIKSNNRLTSHIRVNGKELTDTEKSENFTAIESLGNIETGYDCSGSDPLLIIVAELYGIPIIHKYRGVKIMYENVVAPKPRLVKFYSNLEHFW